MTAPACLHAALFGAAPPASISYRNTYSDVANLTTYTFVGCDIGTAVGGRRVFVAVAATDGSNSAVSSMTIAGVSAALVGRTAQSAQSDPATEIWSAVVNSGATGDVVVTFASGKGRCAISVYAVYGLLNAAPVVATDNDDSNPISANIAVTAGGVLLALGSTNNNSSFAWTGATEDVDVITESSHTHSCASAQITADNAALAISATVTNTPASTNLVVMSWR